MHKIYLCNIRQETIPWGISSLTIHADIFGNTYIIMCVRHTKVHTLNTNVRMGRRP